MPLLQDAAFLSVVNNSEQEQEAGRCNGHRILSSSIILLVLVSSTRDTGSMSVAVSV